MNIKDSVITDIATLIGKGDEVSKKESAILSILMLHWGKEKIKQRAIIEHPYWKSASTGNGVPETAMREVRRSIRNLRVKFGIPIMHSSEGHYLPETQEEVDDFMERLEKEVTRHTSSSYETYQVLKNSLGVTSNLLDRMDVAGVQVVSYEKV